jgi:hypothetical protein
MKNFVCCLRLKNGSRRGFRFGITFPLVLALFTFTCLTSSMALQVAESKADFANDCLSEVRKILGPTAQVSKCGNFTGGASLGAVGFVKLKQFAENRDGVPVSRLVILQKANSQWSVALDVAKQIQNPSGYVGIDYIDDSQNYSGYRVLFLGRRSDGKPGFVLQLTYLRSNGKSEGIPLEISWNPVTKRFQEFSTNEEPEGFRPELKNPPHINSSRQTNRR